MTVSALPPEIETVVQSIKELQPILREDGAPAEVDRRLSKRVVDGLREAGAFRISVPTRFGGFAANSVGSTAVAREIGYGDGSAAWIYAIVNSGSWLTALLTLQAQQDVWTDNADALISVVLPPTSVADKVAGGYRVTGRWNYGTGSHHADWSLLGIPLVNDQDEMVDAALALIPGSDLQIEDTWFTAGMRGTGSDTQVATDVFVPAHRVLPLNGAFEGKYPGAGVNPEASYRPAFVPALALQLVGPHLGMGRAVLDTVVEKAVSRGIAYTGYSRQADSVGFQLAVARAALLLDTADLVTREIGEQLYTSALAGRYAGYGERVAIRGKIGYAVECVTDAVGSLILAHGSSAFAESSMVQRFWRDQTTAASHAHALPATGFDAYGKILLGLEKEARAVLPGI
jgi:3-hydroxy-9,10-secoandrosta-1,3,5(10)-triene-9,17-dione monooxygenase